MTTNTPLIWLHYCPAEKTKLGIGRGEACNWCGEKENIMEQKDATAPAREVPDAVRVPLHELLACTSAR